MIPSMTNPGPERAGTRCVCAVAVLACVVGCGDEPRAGGLGSAQTTTCAASRAEPHRARGRGEEWSQVHRVTAPERKGLRLRYRSDVSTFNLLGDASGGPLTPETVWDYRRDDSRRAVIVLDELSGAALSVMYDDFGDGQKQFTLSGEEDRNTGWLLRGESREGITHENVKQFLGGRKTGAFRLRGRVTITLRDGYVQEVGLVNLSTAAPVPPDKPSLRAQVDFWKHQRSELGKQSAAAPDKKILKWGVRQAEENLRRCERLLEGGAESAAQFTDGRITAAWVRSEPMFKIDLP